MMVGRRTFVAGLLAVAFVAPLAARADVLQNTVGKPAWVKTYGNLRVERFGSNGPALILIPGLASGPWTWYDTVAHEQATHAIYSVTVAGMSDYPAQPNPSLDATDASLLALIQGEKIVKPVLVGHSMGGYLALRFGTEHPELLRGIVDVDGLPILPTQSQMTPEQRTAASEQIATSILAQSQDEYLKTEAKIVRDYVTDPALAQRVIDLCAQSDQKTVAEYFKELFAADLRPALPKLTVPTLLIAPNPGLPLPSYIPAQGASMTLDDRRNYVVALYNQLMVAAPDVRVVAIDNARHFVMLDQPDAFIAALNAFLANLPPA
jgi:pimeloyl-ACP methyl ester carboxylesterase